MLTASVIQKRFADLPGPPLTNSLQCLPGNARDYHLLSSYHYRDSRPGSMMRIIALRDTQSTAVGRYHSQKQARVQTVGVLVESNPSLCCSLRAFALGRWYASLKNKHWQAVMIQRELRCISRVIVHPQWRGLGLAVRLVRYALSTATTPLTEALAAMGQVHPFFYKAGMTAYRRPRHAYDARLLDALLAVGIASVQITCRGWMLDHIAQLSSPQQALIKRELTMWHRHVLQQRYKPASLEDQLCCVQKRLLSEPVYYLHDNRVPPEPPEPPEPPDWSLKRPVQNRKGRP